MAKNKHTDPVKERNGRLIRTEAYAEKVRQLFAATVNEILTLNKTMPDIANGVMYSFDGDTKKVQQQVEALLRRLHSVATMAIQKGITLEWDAAEKACDAMVQSCFGKQLMSNPNFKAWTAHNDKARDAFVKRSEKGLNLSARVWRDVQSLRDEMEVAITVAMGEGEDAGTISRQVRKYLNDPDLMFRRFQYHEKEAVLDADGNPVLDKHGKPKLQDKLGKDGNPIVKKKWKKRIADPEHPGKYKWIDYDRDSYVPMGAGGNSRGVYKSAAKNAMRVARTETNMAYRAADHERWSDMDFVLGIHIETSNSHEKKMPKGDICDRLAGDYPRDFDFCGWHPQCFCHATPILPSDDEMLAMAEARDQGKPYKPKGVIRDYPEGFKEWVRENEEKLTDPGLSNPYFVSNNEEDIIKILRGEEIAEPEPTAEQIALMEAEKERAAKEQRENEATHKYGSSILNIMDGIEGVDTSALKSAIESGDYEAILHEAEALKAIGKQIKKTAGNVLSTASDYGEVDASELQAIMDAGKIGEMRAATKALAQQILKQKQFEASISDLIPDAHDWHKQFTAAELQVVHDVVESKLAGWAHLSLEEQKKKLEFEAIDFLGGNMHGVQSKYATWKVSQAAYLKKLDAVQQEIFWQEVSDDVAELAAFKCKSAPYNTMVADLQTAIANKDKATITSLLQTAKDKKDAIEGARGGGKPTPIKLPDLDEDERKKMLKAFQTDTVSKIDKHMRPQTEKQWANFGDEEKLVATKYTQTYSYLNEPLRGITYSGGRPKSEYTHDLPILTKALNKCKLKKSMVVRRGTSDYNIPELGKKLSAVDVGDEFTDGGFLSTAMHPTKGFFRSYNLIIYAPKGTRGIFAEPFTHYNGGSYDYAEVQWDDATKSWVQKPRLWNGKDAETIGHEFEFIGQRGTRFRCVGKSGTTIYLQIIGQLM